VDAILPKRTRHVPATAAIWPNKPDESMLAPGNPAKRTEGGSGSGRHFCQNEPDEMK
jgi:hypothetical protein